MKNLIIFIVLLIGSVTTYAQQFPSINHIYLNNNLSNPSLTGLSDKVDLMLIQRNTLVGFEQNPKTLYLNVAGPVVSNRMGVGLNLYSESLGITKKTGVYGSYAYRINFEKEHNLSFGLSLGILQFSIDPDAVDVTNNNDPVLLNKNFNASAVDGMFGATYIKSNFQFGIGTSQILSNKEKLSTTVNYNLERNYQATVQYKLYLNGDQSFSITPLVVARYAKSTLPQEAHIILNYRDKFYFVPSYKSSGSVAITSSAYIYNRFRVGYSYEAMITTPVKGNQRGGHEIMIGYSFDILSKSFKNQQNEIDKLTEKLADFQRTQSTKDSLQNEDIRKVKEGLSRDSLRIAENKNNLERTEAELLALKNKLIKAGVIREFDVTEYEGNPVKGYYLVIASVKNTRYNQEAMDREYLSQGYKKVYNVKRGWHYVYTVRVDDFAEALNLLKTTRRDVKKDAWIHILK